MASEGNKIVNDGLCSNGCGFFGSAATMNLCSKCYRDVVIKDQQSVSVKSAVDKLMNQNQEKVNTQLVISSPSENSSAAGEVSEPPPVVVGSNRCLSCRKKVGVTGFKCKCGCTFCGTHRYPEKHDCTFDFKSQGKEVIAKANPVVKADRMENRI